MTFDCEDEEDIRKPDTVELAPSSPRRNTPINYEEVLTTAATRLTMSSSRSCQENADIDAMSNTSSHPSHRPPSSSLSVADEATLLSSLPQRPVANFPCEGDRKRVLGCLAAVISMMYDYEEWDEKEMNHSLSSALPEVNNNDGCSLSTSENVESCVEQPGSPMVSSTRNINDDQIQSSGSSEKTKSHKRRSMNFGKGREDSKGNNEKHRKEGTSGSVWKNGGGSNEGSTVNSRRTNGRVIQMYKRRRHAVYKEFLISAAGLLLLEKGNAIAFLPLLNSLLSKEDLDLSNEIGGESRMVRTSGLTNKGQDSAASLGRSSCSKKPLQEQYDSKPRTWDNNELLCPFAESITAGAGLQCLSLLLVNFLLGNKSGYDARIRHVMKKVGVILFVQEFKRNGVDEELKSQDSNVINRRYGRVSIDDILIDRATRQFEALERAIASKILWISALQEEKVAAEKKTCEDGKKSKSATTRDSIMRGLKVGSVGVAAGTLFAVTGGLAAPGIAAGLAASGFTVATTSLVTTLTSTAAVTTIFGVGGGGLAAYKTHRRIKGLTEFSFQKEKRKSMQKSNDKKHSDAELFSTICISGWLKDTRDFQRPWGVEPSNPPLEKLERLMRFYVVFKPENVPRSQEILKTWEGNERKLWLTLREKYGRDPDHVLPIPQNSRYRMRLTHEEDEVINNLLVELGYPLAPREDEFTSIPAHSTFCHDFCSHGETFDVFALKETHPRHETLSSTSETAQNAEKLKGNQDKTSPKNTLVLWDYEAEYGGEIYTIRWETDLLMELCDSVTDLAVDLVGNAAREILKQTALSTLISAIAWPYGLVRAANMIDGTWTLAIERADLAGVELARSLLESQAGHRPITLVGFSMGARTIYSCLKELARHQELWEVQQQDRQSKVEKHYVNRKTKSQSKKKGDKINYLREPASIIEDAILMGTPNHLSISSWETCRCIVAGRLVNCYSSTDLILSLMFQIKRFAGVLRPVCGVSPVNVHGVENYDVSPFITAHSDYCSMTGQILRMIRHGQPYRPSSTIVIPSEFSGGENSST